MKPGAGMKPEQEPAGMKSLHTVTNASYNFISKISIEIAARCGVSTCSASRATAPRSLCPSIARSQGQHIVCGRRSSTRKFQPKPFRDSMVGGRSFKMRAVSVPTDA